jgi:hypothetical protein
MVLPSKQRQFCKKTLLGFGQSRQKQKKIQDLEKRFVGGIFWMFHKDSEKEIPRESNEVKTTLHT